MLSSGLFIRISMIVINSSHFLKPAMFSGVIEEDGRLTPIGALNNMSQCALQVDDGFGRTGDKNIKD